MDEDELQRAVEIAFDIVERGDLTVALVLEVADDPRAAAEKLIALSQAIVKLGGGTVRPRTPTIRGVTSR